MISAEKNTGTDVLDALDALDKIRSILNAAMYLNANTSERRTSIELIGLAEEVAARVLEAAK